MTEKPNFSNANKAREETKLQPSMQLNTTARQWLDTLSSCKYRKHSWNTQSRNMYTCQQI